MTTNPLRYNAFRWCVAVVALLFVTADAFAARPPNRGSRGGSSRSFGSSRGSQRAPSRSFSRGSSRGSSRSSSRGVSRAPSRSSGRSFSRSSSRSQSRIGSSRSSSRIGSRAPSRSTSRSPSRISRPSSFSGSSRNISRSPSSIGRPSGSTRAPSRISRPNSFNGSSRSISRSPSSIGRPSGSTRSPSRIGSSSPRGSSRSPSRIGRSNSSRPDSGLTRPATRSGSSGNVIGRRSSSSSSRSGYSSPRQIRSGAAPRDFGSSAARRGSQGRSTIRSIPRSHTRSADSNRGFGGRRYGGRDYRRGGFDRSFAHGRGYRGSRSYGFYSPGRYYGHGGYRGYRYGCYDYGRRFGYGWGYRNNWGYRGFYNGGFFFNRFNYCPSPLTGFSFWYGRRYLDYYPYASSYVSYYDAPVVVGSTVVDVPVVYDDVAYDYDAVAVAPATEYEYEYEYDVDDDGDIEIDIESKGVQVLPGYPADSSSPDIVTIEPAPQAVASTRTTGEPVYSAPAEPAAPAESEPLPSQAEQMLQMGDEAFSAARYDDARRYFVQAQSDETYAGDATLAYAIARFAEGDYGTSATALRHGLSLVPDAINFPMDLTMLYGQSNKDLPQHLGKLRNHVLANPQDQDAWLLFGYTMFGAGDLMGAIDAFRKSTELNAQDSLATQLLGSALNIEKALKEQAQQGNQQPDHGNDGGSGATSSGTLEIDATEAVTMTTP